jgi:hypothetical protein
VAALVSAAAGSHARSFNQNTAFGKVNGVINDKNNFDVSYNYQRFRSPHGYFNTPTSTGDGLGLTDGATSRCGHSDGGAAKAYASRFDHDNHEYLWGRGDKRDGSS